MKEISQTYSKFEKRYLEGNSEFRVIVYCLILKMMARNWENLIFYGIAKIFIDPVGLGRN